MLMTYRSALFVGFALATLLAGIFGFPHLFTDAPGKADDTQVAAELTARNAGTFERRQSDLDRDTAASGVRSTTTQNGTSKDRAVKNNSAESASGDELNEAVRRLVDAGSADEMERAIDKLAGLDPELAETKLRQLYDFCNTPWEEPESVKERKKAFCQDYVGVFASGTLDANREELMSVNFGLRVQEQIAADLRRTPETRVSEWFTQRIGNARFPEEIDVLITLNHQRSHRPDDPFWRLGYDIWLDQFPEANILNAQEVALLLFRCMRFGGCRNDQYFTIIYCASVLSGRCDPSANLEELLYRTRPPAEFVLAQEILSRLLAEIS